MATAATDRVSRFFRRLWMALLAVVVLYGLAQLWVRSPWFRVTVERSLSRVAGMEVRTGRIRATESLNLKIRDVIGMAENAGLEAKILRIRWKLLPGREGTHIESIRAEDVVLTMAPDEDGVMQPAFIGQGLWGWLARLEGGLLERGISAEGVVPPGDGGEETDEAFGWNMRGEIPYIRITRGLFSLRDASGRERAAAQDVGLERTVENGLEQWDFRAAVVSVEGVQLTGVHWAAEVSNGVWRVTAMEADGWSGWVSHPENTEAAAAQYRDLFDWVDSAPPVVVER